MVAIRSRVKASSRLTIVPDVVIALSFLPVSGDCILYGLEVKFGTEPSSTLKQSLYIFDITFRLFAQGWRALILLSRRLE